MDDPGDRIPLKFLRVDAQEHPEDFEALHRLGKRLLAIESTDYKEVLTAL
jgi:hypothetical protein